MKDIDKNRRIEIHRNAAKDRALYAERFLKGRLKGFKKDIEICTKGYMISGKKSKTHAYMPALITCISYLEYMATLFTGNIQKLTAQSKVNQYSRKFLDQNIYSKEDIRILYKVFRNPIAHRGIPSGVIIDHKDNEKRRITWKIYVRPEKSAISIQKKKGILQRDPPWDVPFNYRGIISIGRLWRDLIESVEGESGFIDCLKKDNIRLNNFFKIMKKLYPV